MKSSTSHSESTYKLAAAPDLLSSGHPSSEVILDSLLSSSTSWNLSSSLKMTYILDRGVLFLSRIVSGSITSAYLILIKHKPPHLPVKQVNNLVDWQTQTGRPGRHVTDSTLSHTIRELRVSIVEWSRSLDWMRYHRQLLFSTPSFW